MSLDEFLDLIKEDYMSFDARHISNWSRPFVKNNGLPRNICSTETYNSGLIPARGTVFLGDRELCLYSGILKNLSWVYPFKTNGAKTPAFHFKSLKNPHDFFNNLDLEWRNYKKNSAIDAFIQKTGIPIVRNVFGEASYNIETRIISMAYQSNIVSDELYYKILLHEVAHTMGHSQHYFINGIITEILCMKLCENLSIPMYNFHVSYVNYMMYFNRASGIPSMQSTVDIIKSCWASADQWFCESDIRKLL